MSVFARTRASQLIAASFVVLFQELTLIRWIPGEVRAIAYFPNVVLISAFLGLGVGCLRVSGRSLLWLWPVSLVVLTATAAVLSRVAFTQESTSEHLWLHYYNLPADAPVVRSIRLPVVLFFLLSAITFVPLGQYVALRLREFSQADAALWGYAADLSGSLLGVLGFAAMSFWSAFPFAWFCTVLIAGVAIIGLERRQLALYGVAAAAVLGIVVASERADTYSPYYAINVLRSPEKIDILTNGSLHQVAMPTRLSDSRDVDWINHTRDGYHLPYRKLGRRPRRVLVVGAGTGNDVAVALDEGAEHVDAIEIDPAILRAGRLHPDDPYASPKVRVINTDARAFLNHSQDKYDLIVFGTLDSMTRLSALSSVRLDNFVYTTDSMEAARRHLTDDGGLVLYFQVAQHFIDDHIIAMLAHAFSQRPYIIDLNCRMFDRIFMIGPGFAHLQQNATLSSADVTQLVQGLDEPTDDWPYLYLEHRGIGTFYLSLIGILLVLSVLSVFVLSREMRHSLRTGGFDPEMFLFGVAFLLLETKLVTEMNLVWGATWVTSAVVFGSILLTLLCGTVLTAKVRVPWPVGVGGLLLATYVMPLQKIVGSPPGLRLMESLAFIGLPVLFASICFAVLFAARAQPEISFGWNMLGAVTGGFLEFVSMAIGIKATTLLALVAYLAAILIAQRRAALRAPVERSAAPGTGDATAAG